MTLPFSQRFLALAKERSPLCVGIDPSAEALKGWGLPDDAAGLRAFCQRLVETCAPLVASVKPQSAFFERHGPAGLEVLRQTVEAATAHGAVVIRSSNPEGSELQRARLPDGRSVAECLADEITESNAAASSDELGCIGAVLGATQGAEADELAERLPHSLLLVPGIGAQGATIADVRRDFARHYGRVVPSISRGIAGAGPAAADLKRAVERYIAEIRSTA